MTFSRLSYLDPTKRAKVSLSLYCWGLWSKNSWIFTVMSCVAGFLIPRPSVSRYPGIFFHSPSISPFSWTTRIARKKDEKARMYARSVRPVYIFWRSGWTIFPWIRRSHQVISSPRAWVLYIWTRMMHLSILEGLLSSWYTIRLCSTKFSSSSSSIYYNDRISSPFYVVGSSYPVKSFRFL